tara:strand:- start:413 stop:733 length:321 start_codon:yes stop_codon:yes gene_type:complete
MKEIKYLYRYTLEYWQGTAKINLKEYPILRYTPKGCWINIGYNREKWVSNNARTKFAQPSIREALKHYVRRKMYRNNCILNEMNRNDVTIIVAKQLLKEHDKQRKK